MDDFPVKKQVEDRAVFPCTSHCMHPSDIKNRNFCEQTEEDRD